MIEVRVFATLREGREKIQHLDATKHATVKALLLSLSIAEDEVAICLVNGFHSSLDTAVKGGDVISLFPAVGGG